MAGNVGSLDRIIRGVVGTGRIAVAVMSHGPIRWLGLVGVVLIVTAFVRFCPAYWLMRVQTLGGPR
jgi:hypothetical protein